MSVSSIPKQQKRKAEESAELLRLELLHSKKVDSDESQQGAAVSTRSMKQDLEKADLNPVRDEPRTVKRK